MQKNETGKKIHICSEFPENFKANRSQTFLIFPMDHLVKLWNNLFGFSKSISPMYYFLTGFHRKLSLTINHSLVNVALKWYKTVRWAPCLVFLDDSVIPGMKGTPFVLHLQGNLVRIWGYFLVVPDFAKFFNDSSSK